MIEKSQIITYGHINTLLLDELDKSLNKKQKFINIDKVYNNVEKRMGVDTKLESFYKFINFGTITSLMYTSLVMSKELFNNSENGEKFFSSLNINISDYFVLTNVEVDSTYQFLRKLRNSISHANFKLNDDNFNIKLWDEYNKKINFEVKSDITRLSNFSLIISNYITNNKHKI